jgi:uncharacterized sulfatase
VIEPGSRSTALVSLVDLVPTLVAAAGGSPPTDIDGRSFLPILTGRESEFRDAVFTTHSGDGNMNEYPIRAVRTAHWKYIRNLRPEAEFHTHIDLGKPDSGSRYWASWVERAKSDDTAAEIVRRYVHRPAEELYDLDNDPLEMNNLVADPQHAELVSDLRTKLDNWMHSQGDAGLATEQRAAESLPNPLPPP